MFMLVIGGATAIPERVSAAPDRPPRSPGLQREERTLLVLGQRAVALPQVPREAVVVVEPPRRRAGHEQILRPAPAQALELGDRLLGVPRVAACICAVVLLREVPCAAR